MLKKFRNVYTVSFWLEKTFIWSCVIMIIKPITNDET